MIRFSTGNVQLSLLDAGDVWLDGGAMFGVVPRVLWQREREPDERHRIRLTMRLLLIEDGRRRILVDTGAGDKWDDKTRDVYGIEARLPAEILEPVGLKPEQIDIVVNTHLHFDHAGGNTYRDETGRLRPAFPNARYLVQRGEFEMANWDNERIRASYIAENYRPLADEPGRMEFLDGDARLGSGIELLVAPGHTPHMQMVRVDGGGETFLYPADLVPTSSHLPYPYIMGFDLEPLVTLRTKKAVLPRALSESWRVIFEHDDRLAVGTLYEERGKLRARTWQPEA